MEIISINQTDTLSHLKLSGRLDTPGVDRIEARFNALTVARGRDTVIDLEELDLITSMGIRMLVTAAKSLAVRGRKLVLLNPQGVVDDTLRATDLYAVISDGAHLRRGRTALCRRIEHSAPIRVLFLCTHNSARSQMAEALLRQLGGDRFHVESAGTQPSRVHPLAAQTMSKRGLDISRHGRSTSDELVERAFDYVITVCGRCERILSHFPRCTRAHSLEYPRPIGARGRRRRTARGVRARGGRAPHPDRLPSARLLSACSN